MCFFVWLIICNVISMYVYVQVWYITIAYECSYVVHISNRWQFWVQIIGNKPEQKRHMVEVHKTDLCERQLWKEHYYCKKETLFWRRIMGFIFYQLEGMKNKSCGIVLLLLALLTKLWFLLDLWLFNVVKIMNSLLFNSCHCSLQSGLACATPKPTN